MAIVYWKGGASAVAQVADASIDTYDAASTYTVTIGGYTVSVAGDTDVATTAAALVAALNLATVPYFAAITWSVPSGSTIRATADVAGAPFVAALSVAGGTGTVTSFSDATACTGPHHADEVENWSSGALPTTADEVVIDSGASILYGLDALTAVALSRATVRQTYAGLIGLEPSQFATSLDGVSVDVAFREYRDAYFELSADEITVGEEVVAGVSTGSARLCIEQKKAGTSVLRVETTSASGLNGRPVVRFLAAHASADVQIATAPGGLGIATEAGETATVGAVFSTTDDASTSVIIGQGVTYTSYSQAGGTGRVAAAATVSVVEQLGGTLTLYGFDYLISNLRLYGGTLTDIHENTGGAEWTTILVAGGTLVLPTGIAASRAFTTMSLQAGRVEADWSALTGTVSVVVDTNVKNTRALEITAL